MNIFDTPNENASQPYYSTTSNNNTANFLKDDSSDEDNNPFAGTNHMYASGMASAPDSHVEGSDILRKPHYIYEENEQEVEEQTDKQGQGQESQQNVSIRDDKNNNLIVQNNNSMNRNNLSTRMDENMVQSIINNNNENLSDYSNYTVPSSPDSLDSRPSSSNTSNSSHSSHSTKTTSYEPYENLSMSMANAFNYHPDNNNNNNNNNDNDNIDNSDFITIIDSGDFNDPWGKHAIGYVIKYKDKEVIRRYSEFNSLHQVLIKLLPTIVIPPIPSKHSLFKYFINPINAQNDSKVIEKRKRRFTAFLNNCNNIPDIKNNIVFQKFLNPEYVWKDVLNSPPVSILPLNNLLAPPLSPTKPSPLHLLLPSPTSLSKAQSINMEFINNNNTNNNSDDNNSMNKIKYEKQFNHIEKKLALYLNTLQPLLLRVKNNKSHVHSLSSQLAELGAYYNALSLENNQNSLISTTFNTNLSNGIEKIGHSFDVSYVSTEIMVENIQNIIEESLDDIIKLLLDSKRVIIFKNLKNCQYQIIINTISKRNSRLKELKDFEKKLKRLDQTLNRDTLTATSLTPSSSSSSAGIVIANIDTNTDTQQQKDINTSTIIHNTEEIVQLQLQKNKRKLGKDTRNRYGQIETEFLTKVEREEEIKKLTRELKKLRDCESLITNDIEQVYISTLNNLNALLSFINKNCEIMMKAITKSILDWVRESLKAWKNAKSTIDEI